MTPASSDDERVDGDQQRRQGAVDQRAVDEPVDRVQPVARDRDRHRDRRPGLQQRQRHDVGADVEQRRPAEPERDQQRAVGEPADLAAQHVVARRGSGRTTPPPLRTARPAARPSRSRRAPAPSRRGPPPRAPPAERRSPRPPGARTPRRAASAATAARRPGTRRPAPAATGRAPARARPSRRPVDREPVAEQHQRDRERTEQQDPADAVGARPQRHDSPTSAGASTPARKNGAAAGVIDGSPERALRTTTAIAAATARLAITRATRPILSHPRRLRPRC